MYTDSLNFPVKKCIDLLPYCPIYGKSKGEKSSDGNRLNNWTVGLTVGHFFLCKLRSKKRVSIQRSQIINIMK
jgi:hypothetical protein